ncbi:Ribonuclease T2, variant 2 [Schistosoma haematobium]|uniref:Ribonuclease T2, variant 2 n=1 Tax=Schistosoma haematobium TaxID=6185 RepID=A0A922S4K4_SCHHA|nr:Ribonuclease T2, variant 2 [Schistosoma haematobium]KAH9593629.1 Ribonuclease T2, variant 2 [Schistosoma haematobium]
MKHSLSFNKINYVMMNCMSRFDSIKIKPNNLVTLKRDVVLNQLRSSFGVNVLMVCSFQNDKPAKLSEIRLCLNPSLEFIDCPISGNKNDYQQFSNSFYHQNIYHNPVCKSSLPWLYQSPICYNQSSILLFYNAPCPEELIFPDFN